MQRTPPPLPLFAVLSAGLHLVAFGAIRQASAPGAVVFDPTSQTLSGDTLDIEPPAPPSDDSEATGSGTATRTAAVPNVPGASRARSSASLAASPSPAGEAAHAALFGAVGARFATDLATTFTRAFPQGASADPVWSTAPFGRAGSAEVTLVLDDAGRIASSSIAGAPSVSLRRGIERTLSLLGPRTFTARAAVTRLRVTARVTRDDVHDGLHGDVFALSGGSVSGDLGSAFFALPPAAGPGRRIDVELRLLP